MEKINYKITLMEPLRIVNQNSSKNDELEGLSYIPGATMRGAVMSLFLDELKVDERRKQLLLNWKFLNAYPYIEGRCFFPSPMGLYETKKADGKVENILYVDEVSSGMKRASVGEFASVKNNTLYYTSVRKKEDLGINIEQNDIFRKTVIAKGQEYCGSIISDSPEELKKRIDGIEIRLGGNKTSGCGLCKIEVLSQEVNDYMHLESGEYDEITMILLSDTVMRNSKGEICGIDEEILAKEIGCKSVAITKASTALTKKSGINRKWGVRTPEYVMYKAGSAFLLRFSEKVNADAFVALMKKGIGVGRTEGFGQICFTAKYNLVTEKTLLKNNTPVTFNESILKATEEERKAVARRIAEEKLRGLELDFIVLNNDKVRMSRSQLGICLNIAKNATYNIDGSKAYVDDFLEHTKEKLDKEKNQLADAASRRSMITLLESHKKNYLDIIGARDMKVMGYCVNDLFSKKELEKKSYDLLAERITYYTRKKKNM